MEFLPITTRLIRPPKDDLFAVLDESLPPLQNGDIVLITSKIVAIHQGRCVSIGAGVDKDALVKQEAERYLPRESNPHHMFVTLKGHTLIGSAGIDESNADGYYILWPEQPSEAAREIWRYLRTKHGLENLGVIITDSQSVPQRRGASGVAIGFYGLKPLEDYRGKPDLFGRLLKAEQANRIDPLAQMAVYLMGEAAEGTPMVIARGVPKVVFTDQPTHEDFFVSPDNDIFRSIYEVFERGEK